MKDYRIKVNVIIIIMAFLGCILLISLLLFMKLLEPNELDEFILNYGLISFPLGVFWWFFDSTLWKKVKIKWMKKYLRIPPNLSGRWEGLIDRYGENNPHKFVLEIKQNLTSLQIFTYSQNGKSKSIVDDIVVTDKMNERFRLCYLWSGTGGPLKYQTKKSSEEFQGYTILDLITNDNSKKLKGYYFTNRLPNQTKGEIEVDYISNKLMNEF